jgi:predicted porin
MNRHRVSCHPKLRDSSKRVQELEEIALKASKLCLAIAGSFVVPAAMAQTANPVTVYGRVYITVESVEAKGGTTPGTQLVRMRDQSSLLGVRGEEDLGGGLKAFFQLETGFNPEQPSGTFAGRNSGVGLRGTWGSVMAGRWDTPFKQTMVGSVDPWTDLQIGDITGAAIRQGDFSIRASNIVQYWSPTFANTQVKLMWVPNETRTAQANPSMYGGAITWGRGDASLSYAYEKHREMVDQATTPDVDEEGHGISGEYRFGPVKLSGQYGEYARTGSTKQKSYQVGAQWYIGKHQLIATYSASKDGGAVNGAQPECDLAALGYRYNFSRRTFFITSYARVENDVGRLCNFGSGALTIGNGQDPQGYSVGVRHVF